MESDIFDKHNILNSSRDDEDLELKQRNSINDSLNQLDSQLNKLENSKSNPIEEKKIKEKIAYEKISSIPSMMRCSICEDYCDDAVQITCCCEVFCEKHIREEIMKNFTCPNCKKGATMRDVIPNKKLRENIQWYKSLLSEQTIGTFPTIVANTAIPPVASQPKPTLHIPIPNAAMPVQVSNTLSSNSMIIEKIAPKKTDIDKIADSKEQEMTPEEKMQLYNKKLTESDTRKKSEDKFEDNKSSTSADKKSIKENPLSMVNPIGDKQNPLNPLPVVVSSSGYPVSSQVLGSGMTYPRGMIPYMMQYPYMGMYPYSMPNLDEGKKKSKSSRSKSSSSSSSDESKSSSKHRRRRRPSRSRSKSKSRSRSREKKREKSSKKDKKRDHDKEKKRSRHRDKNSKTKSKK